MNLFERWKIEWKPLVWIAAVFLACFYLPVGNARFDGAVAESFELVKWYAREHVLLCLIPAFFIAGAIGTFVSQASVMKYLGARANRALAYGVAAISGTILAVCSCTVLPLFGGIYKRGAGLGPASAFLYSGPAINVLAIILTARILGLELGVARAVGAVVFSVVIGLLMAFIFRKEEQAKAEAQLALPEPPETRPLRQTILYFAAMVGVLVFANWGKPEVREGFWFTVWSVKWWITAGFAILFAVALTLWFGMKPTPIILASGATLIAAVIWRHEPLIPFAMGFIALTLLTSSSEGENGDWWDQTWGFAKQIMPLLFWGVLISGFLLGRPGREGIIPSEWVASSVGGNSFRANFLSSLVGAFMYFATLTEVPILQGLIGSGMGKGPALALLLAGPALSLPNMLVLNSIMGIRKTVVYCSLVVVMATFTGMLYGWIG